VRARPLLETDLEPSPLRQFAAWFAEAEQVVETPETMALATATREGVPSVRTVLLKGHDARGFVFFTGLGSRKGRELTENPRAALLFHWPPLGRQVRIEGDVERVHDDDAATYFATRPRGTQLGAWASRQSEPIDGRDHLEAAVAAAAARFDGRDVPLPPHWGGFRVVPDAWEFWQHREDRLHDRFRYVRAGEGWQIRRLAP
jgi:pyridoxamine 5'-phosphate oxidase